MHLKRNTERADGKVFWAYKTSNGIRKEVWITKEQYSRWEATRLNYVKKKIDLYRQEQQKLPPEERNYIGKKDPLTGLFFCKVSTSGKPVFVTWEKLQEYKVKNLKRKKEYYERCKKLDPPTVCLGDKHPTIDGLFVKRMCNNKVFYGTYEEAYKNMQSLKNSCKKYKQTHRDKIKARQKESLRKKMEFLEKNPELKRRRGDIDPILKRVFWHYSNRGNEFWISEEKFKKYSERAKLKRKMLRLRKEKKSNEQQL